MRRRDAGFTLVEIAIVLVIIGLLLGGILKGQQLINSARVRNLADTSSGIQAAYYGFIDRYRAVPGDMPATQATQAIGTTITVGGNGDGQVGGSAGPDTAAASADWGEASALWVQLTASGFLQGSYAGGATSAATYTGNAGGPLNAFNGEMLLGRGQDYASVTGTTYNTPATGKPPMRLILIFGNNIPVSIARELDVKIDDGKPGTGSLRETGATGQNVTWSTISDSTSTDCVDTTTSTPIYNIAGDAQNCNLALIY